MVSTLGTPEHREANRKKNDSHEWIKNQEAEKKLLRNERKKYSD